MSTVGNPSLTRATALAVAIGTRSFVSQVVCSGVSADAGP